MLKPLDIAAFDEFWRTKLDRGDCDAEYRHGQNLGIDKTLQVISSGKRLLDIGCGTEILATQLKGKFDQVFGVDISELPIEVARKNGVTATRVNLNTDRLPYEDSFFDAVTILATLQYVYDVDFVFRECVRVLKPSGEFIVNVPNMRASWRIWKLAVCGRFPRPSINAIAFDSGALHYFCHADLIEALKARGFQITSSCGLFCVPHLLNSAPDSGLLGYIKREFFSAELLTKAVKR